MQHEKRRLEEVYREISEWEITEESGDAASVGPAETVDAEQLDAYLKTVESRRYGSSGEEGGLQNPGIDRGADAGNTGALVGPRVPGKHERGD